MGTGQDRFFLPNTVILGPDGPEVLTRTPHFAFGGAAEPPLTRPDSPFPAAPEMPRAGRAVQGALDRRRGGARVPRVSSPLLAPLVAPFGDISMPLAPLARAAAARAAAGCVAAALLWAGLAGPARGQPEAPPVDVATPLAREIVEHDVYTGRFEAVDRVEIRSRVSGYLDRVHFEDGEIVATGKLLFTIDQRTFRAEVARAEAQVKAAEAGRLLASIELERAQTLAERNVGTTQEVDRATATLAEAEANLAVAEAELRQARLNLDFTEIRAPFRGRMSSAKVDPGNLIVGGAASSTLLSTIVSLDPIHFVFTVSEADFLRYSRLHGGPNRTGGRPEPLDIGVRLMDEERFIHQGRLDFLDSEINPNSGTIIARALIPNPDLFLVPGVFGRVRIPASTPFEALLIPDAAVLSDQARKIVYVVGEDGTVSVKPVELGDRHRGLRVIRDGLLPDDRVIVAGLQRARPGAKVTPEEVTLELEGG